MRIKWSVQWYCKKLVKIEDNLLSSILNLIYTGQCWFLLFCQVWLKSDDSLDLEKFPKGMKKMTSWYIRRIKITQKEFMHRHLEEFDVKFVYLYFGFFKWIFFKQSNRSTKKCNKQNHIENQKKHQHKQTHIFWINQWASQTQFNSFINF